MAVSSYRKSFAVANTSNTGGKLLVLQTQDSHRTNLRAVRSQVDNGRGAWRQSARGGAWAGGGAAKPEPPAIEAAAARLRLRRAAPSRRGRGLQRQKKGRARGGRRDLTPS